jgi:hypothetical protein
VHTWWNQIKYFWRHFTGKIYEKQKWRVQMQKPQSIQFFIWNALGNFLNFAQVFIQLVWNRPDRYFQGNYPGTCTSHLLTHFGGIWHFEAFARDLFNFRLAFITIGENRTNFKEIIQGNTLDMSFHLSVCFSLDALCILHHLLTFCIPWTQSSDFQV